MPARIDQYENLLSGNPIWMGRIKGVGYLSAEDAIALGVTGPPLRASGVDWDLRRDMPYSRLREVRVCGAGVDGGRRVGAVRGAGAGDARVGEDLPAGAGLECRADRLSRMRRRLCCPIASR